MRLAGHVRCVRCVGRTARVRGSLACALAAVAVLATGCDVFGPGRPPPPASPVAKPTPEAFESGAPVELAPVGPAPAPADASAQPAARDAKPATRYSASYGARVAKAVRANIIFPPTQFPHVKKPCEVDVSTAPDGRIVGFSVTQSSGSHDWDEAVKRALLRTRTLPTDIDGRVPASLVLRFAPDVGRRR